MNEFNITLNSNADDDFFGSLRGSKSSKLQQLFVDDALSADDKEQSLKYEHPKDVASASIATSTTLVAKVVTAYKQGDMQGNVGLALVQNIDDTCNIIMYKTKAHILTSLKLSPGKDLLYKQKNYWQFYDETSTYWSFSFDKSGDEKDFIEKLNIQNIIFKENHESDPVSEQQVNFSSSDNLAHIIESEGYRNSSSTNETRNSLIKRMAKMGKPLPTLSFNHQTTAEFSDSSDTEVIQIPLTSSQKPSVKPRTNKISTDKSNQQLVSSIVGLSSVANSVFPINPDMECQYMQMLLAEQRMQGSEIRMNMNKLENKIENVLDKLELYDRNGDNQKIEKDDEILGLEEKLLMLKKENRKLKQELQQSISQRSEGNQLEEILYELKDDLYKFKIDYSEGLKHVLFELCRKLKEHNDAMKEMEMKIKDNESKFQKAIWELELNIKRNGALKSEISLLNQKENELKNQLNEKEAEAVKQKHDFLELQNKLVEKNQVTLENTNDAFIKSVMNNLFLDIVEKLDKGSFSHSEQILSLVATSIKQQTLASLKRNVQKD